MRKDEICKAVCEVLQSAGTITAFRYDHFKQSEAVPPPYAIYRRVAKKNFSADGVVYHHGSGADFELYASTPDEMVEIMEQVEELLDENEVFYNLAADTVYIEEEDFYESLYEL